MRKPRVRIALIIFLGVSLITLALATSATGLTVGAARSNPPQASTPTPTEVPLAEPVSQPGSTTGIEWMGVLIVAIILLPILLRKETWQRS